MLVLDELPKVVACLKEYREGGKVVFTDGEKLVIRGVSSFTSTQAAELAV